MFDDNSDTAKFIKEKKKFQAKSGFEAGANAPINEDYVGKIYDERIKVHGAQGHGFAAEIANDTIDKLHGKTTDLPGNNNAHNGADRKVDGIYIQTKYCKTAKDSIDACFNQDGSFRYTNDKGDMLIEVPKGQGKEAWPIYKAKRGLSDQAKMSDYIKEGAISYKTAQLIKQPFHPLSVGYDALAGLTNPRMLAQTGISSIIAFAQNIWKGNNVKDSFAASLSIALKNTGNGVLAAALGGQLAKALGDKLEKLVALGIKKVVKKISERIAKTLLENMQPILGGIISAAAIISIQTTKDTIRLFRKHISVKQYFKNMAKTYLSSTAGSAGGVAGYIGGTYISGPAAPVFSELGAVVADITVGGGTSLLLDFLIEDDELDMLRLFETEFCRISEEYLLTEKEADDAVAEISKKINPDFLKKMFRAKDRVKYSETAIIPTVERIVNKRKKITAPSEKQMEEMFNEIVGNAIASIDENGEWNDEPKMSYRNSYGQNCCPTCGALLGGLGYVFCDYCDNLIGITE